MTYYEILGVSKDAGIDEINQRFRILAKKYHPDINKEPNAQAIFIKIYEAFSILRDENKRKAYDDLLKKARTTEYTNRSYATVKEKNDYSKWRRAAQEEAKYYSENKYDVFTKNVLNKIKDVAMIAAAAGVYTGALVLEGIIRIVIKSCIIAVIGGIVFGIGYLSMRHKQEQNKIEIRKTEVERNVEMNEIITSIKNYHEEFPETKLSFDIKDRKIIILQNGRLGDLFYMLPEQYQAKKNEDISYVIQLSREDVLVGHYVERTNGKLSNFNDTSGPSACVIKYEFRVNDYIQKANVYGEIIKGTEPPKEKTIRGNGYGSDPKMDIYNKILYWLQNGSENEDNHFISDDIARDEEEKLKKEEEIKKLRKIFNGLDSL